MGNVKSLDFGAKPGGLNVLNVPDNLSLHFTHYNFCRVHMSLDGLTPAMAAGKADHVWTLEEMVGLLEPAKTLKSN